MQKDTREENVVTQEEQLFIELQLNVQQAIEVQTMVEAQRRLMEMEQCKVKVVAKRRCAILDIVALMEKNIKISNP
jgi:TPP-dependent indolepyruvate ferredoxin oxidoreductase alpha subunit